MAAPDGREQEAAKPKTLGEALLAFQAEIPTLKLGKDASGEIQGVNKAGKSFSYKYGYLSLDKLHAEVLPVLNRLGLTWITRPTTLGDTPALAYSLRFDSEGPFTMEGTTSPQYIGPTLEEISGTMPLLIEKRTSQSLGSAITYARRYSLTAVLGIVPDEDDDGAEASHAPVTTAKPEDRKMTAAELQRMLKAVEDSGKDLKLLLTAVGAEEGNVTVSQGKAIKTMLAVDS